MIVCDKEELMKRVPLKHGMHPVDLYKRIRLRFNNTILLESMNPPSRYARQSVIVFAPTHLVRIDNERLYVNGVQRARGMDSVLNYLRAVLGEFPIDPQEHFTGGLVGFTSYSIIGSIEEIGQRHPKEFPDAMYGFYLDGIVLDHVNNESYYFHHEKFSSRYTMISEIIDEPVPEFTMETSSPRFRTSKEDYMQMVESVKERIVNGETYQTVISQRGDFSITGDRIGVYEKLRRINPSPYMYCIEFHDYAIIGSSPELLISKDNRKITTFPIAGTRPKGSTREERERYSEDLLADEKERAEHNMLVDLARNDIGRVSEIGTVRLPQYMSVEEFSHVIHIVSEVEGTIHEGLDQFDAFFSLFPAGTVSGAPKIRAMKIIDSIEGTNRGPYAGAVGYFGLDGNMEQAIAIRTIFGRGEQFHMQAGAGIVLDSDPETEYRETLSKLGALFQVLEVGS